MNLNPEVTKRSAHSLGAEAFWQAEQFRCEWDKTDPSDPPGDYLSKLLVTARLAPTGQRTDALVSELRDHVRLDHPEADVLWDMLAWLGAWLLVRADAEEEQQITAGITVGS